MKTTFKLFVLFFSVLFTSSLHSQSQIQGNLIDEQGEPMSFANILLLNTQDSSLVKGVISAEDGSFRIKNVTPGSYIVQFSMIGYQTYFTSPNRITPSRNLVDLKTIILKEDAQVLNEIEVTAKKPIFEQKIDRLIVNVQNSITSAGSSALEVLERSPGVIVNRQSEAISLVGKEGVVVMINGKRNYTPVSALVQLLEGMSADNIEKIELITTPPANYDAEGNAGFINIVLKENADEGLNGGFALSAGYGRGDVSSANFNFNYRKNRFNLFGDYSFSLRRRDQTFQFDRDYIFEKQAIRSETVSERDPSQRNILTRIGFDYTLNDKTVVGGLISGYDNKWSMDAMNQNSIAINGAVDTLVQIKNDEINHWKHFMANLNLQHDFDESSQINLNADYLYYHDDNPTNYVNSYFNAQNEFLFENQTRSGKITPISIWVGTADYSKSFGEKIKLQAGLKGTLSTFENDVSADMLVSEIWVNDEMLTNSSTLNEKIGAAYASTDIKLDDKTDVKLGLRYEYTSSNLSTVETPNLVDRQYGNFFPSVFIAKKFNDANSLNLSYSRRITRPGFKQMAPFVIFVDPNTFFAGNPAIQPAISNNFKVDVRHKTLLVSIQYSREDSSIVRFQNTSIPGTHNHLLVSSNLKNKKTASFMIAFPWQITDWWQLQGNVMGIWQKNLAYVNGDLKALSQKNYRLSGAQNFKLANDFSFEISGFYQSKSLSGAHLMKGFGGLNAGLQKKLKDDNGKLSLNVRDVLNTIQWEFEQDVPSQDLAYHALVDFSHRTISVSYSRNFGNKKLKAARNRTTGSEEERKRVD